MCVKIKVKYLSYEKGQVVECDNSTADFLVKAGVAEVCKCKKKAKHEIISNK